MSTIWVCRQKCEDYLLRRQGLRIQMLPFFGEPSSFLSRELLREYPLGILPVRSHMEMLTYSMPLLLYHCSHKQ
jgi:hypothetical protein